MSKEGGRVRESEREIEEERKTKMYSTIFVPDISLQWGSHNAFTGRLVRLWTTSAGVLPRDSEWRAGS